jgi:hypothetical protein
VSPESDGGIDKFEVLSAISGASTPPPPAAPPAPDRPPSATRRAVEPPPPRPAWVRHRHEIAGLVTAFVGLVWLAVGLATASWWPCFTGILFGVASLAIWAIEVWGSD